MPWAIKISLTWPSKCYFTVALDSRSQTHYPRAFVDKNTVDRGKIAERGTQKRPEKCVAALLRSAVGMTHDLRSDL